MVLVYAPFAAPLVVFVVSAIVGVELVDQTTPLVVTVAVTVHKPSAPVDVKFTDIAVTIERHR